MKESDDRAVETLAQVLYDVSDTFGTPWSQRLPDSRSPWQAIAERRLAALGRYQRTSQERHCDPIDMNLRQGEQAIFGIFGKHGKGARPLSLGTLVQGACLPPELVVDALYELIYCGMVDEMPMFSGFGSQPTFRLLPAGRGRLSDEAAVSPVAAGNL